MTRRTTRNHSNTAKQPQNSSSSTPFYLSAVAVVASLLLVVLVFWTSSPPVSESSASLQQTIDVEIVSGMAAGIPYYHCAAATALTSSSPSIDLVLLHGAAFTKEDWTTSGILQKFCSQDGVRATALDLSITAKHDELFTVMDALTEVDRMALPVSGLVTPSASGTIVLGAITSGNVSTLRNYAQLWIPVAANAALKYTADDLKVVQDWPILAIYGDRDSAGRRSSELLNHSGTKTGVVELKGSHPCYLDSPSEFVDTVLKHVVS